jgi:hypothetical protein
VKDVPSIAENKRNNSERGQMPRLSPLNTVEPAGLARARDAEDEKAGKDVPEDALEV